MDNAALKAIIDEYGDRICVILLDNVKKILVGYPSSPLKSVKDITLKTMGTTDVFEIPFDVANPHSVNLGLTGSAIHPTECIQAIYMVGEGMEKYRLDVWGIG